MSIQEPAHEPVVIQSDPDSLRNLGVALSKEYYRDSLETILDPFDQSQDGVPKRPLPLDAQSGSHEAVWKVHGQSAITISATQNRGCLYVLGQPIGFQQVPGVDNAAWTYTTLQYTSAPGGASPTEALISTSPQLALCQAALKCSDFLRPFASGIRVRCFSAESSAQGMIRGGTTRKFIGDIQGAAYQTFATVFPDLEDETYFLGSKEGITVRRIPKDIASEKYYGIESQTAGGTMLLEADERYLDVATHHCQNGMAFVYWDGVPTNATLVIDYVIMFGINGSYSTTTAAFLPLCKEVRPWPLADPFWAAVVNQPSTALANSFAFLPWLKKHKSQIVGTLIGVGETAAAVATGDFLGVGAGLLTTYQAVTSKPDQGKAKASKAAKAVAKRTRALKAAENAAQQTQLASDLAMDRALTLQKRVGRKRRQRR